MTNNLMEHEKTEDFIKLLENNKNNRLLFLSAVKEDGYYLQYASNELRKDKEIILYAAIHDIYAIEYSLLEGYQTFEEVIEKEGKSFFFSCWNNKSDLIKLRVAKDSEYSPTTEQIKEGLQFVDYVSEIYELRKDEWIAKIEGNTLRKEI